jgi:hypothetical protein
MAEIKPAEIMGRHGGHRHQDHADEQQQASYSPRALAATARTRGTRNGLVR